MPPPKSSPSTTFISVLTMEEVPLLSENERADMLKSLAEAEADVAAGRGVRFNPTTFVDDMMTRWAELLNKKAG
jgi:hypothetical protein